MDDKNWCNEEIDVCLVGPSGTLDLISYTPYLVHSILYCYFIHVHRFSLLLRQSCSGK